MAITSDRILVELAQNDRFYKVFMALKDYPQGTTVENICKITGLTDGWVRHVIGRAKMFSNIDAKRRGDNVILRHRPIAADTIVIESTTHTPSTKGSPVAATIQGGTDIVFPQPPEIPDVKVKYSFFEKPEYYDRLKSKILVHQRNIRIGGPPGIGKSSAFEYMAASEYIPLVNINADSGLQLRQLVGGMTDLGRFEVAQFAAAVIYGWWAKIDEANGMNPDAALALNSLLAPPYQVTIHGKSYPVHPSFRLCLTYNPGLVGTKPLPDSLKDRLYPFKVAFPNRSRLQKMMKANGVDVELESVQKMMDFAIAVAKSREGKHKFDMTMRRLLDAYTDIKDGFGPYDALYNACISSIDSIVDATAVLNDLNIIFPQHTTKVEEASK